MKSQVSINTEKWDNKKQKFRICLKLEEICSSSSKKVQSWFKISLNLDLCGNWPRSPLLHKKFAVMSDWEEEEGK